MSDDLGARYVETQLVQRVCLRSFKPNTHHMNVLAQINGIEALCRLDYLKKRKSCKSSPLIVEEM